MQSVKFKCQIITPMFMAGADRRTPELRPSEFKGMMRWWWRAIKAEDNIDRLKKEEADIFGGTGKVEGRSKVKIKMISDKLKSGEYWPLPHKKNFKNPCYLPNSEFQIELKIYDSKYLEKIECLFILTTILGGFGKRSRRGFGSIEIIEPQTFVNYDYILSLLNKIQNSYQLQNNKIVNKRKDNGNYPWIREIEIGEKFYNSYEELLTKIGKASHNYKNPALGSAKPRMASPIYVTIIREGKVYKPIITTLNSYFPKDYSGWDLNKQKQFKEAILK